MITFPCELCGGIMREDKDGDFVCPRCGQWMQNNSVNRSLIRYAYGVKFDNEDEESE